MILYLVIVLLIVAFGGGPALKALFNAILKAFGHGGLETIVNVGQLGDEMPGKLRKEMCATCGVFTDPSKCPLHESEHERSKRNESGIAELWKDVKEGRSKIFGKLDTMDTTLTDIKVAVGKLIVEAKYQQKGRGGRPNED